MIKSGKPEQSVKSTPSILLDCRVPAEEPELGCRVGNSAFTRTEAPSMAAQRERYVATIVAVVVLTVPVVARAESGRAAYYGGG